MRAERTIEQPREVWKVSQWKHDVDISEPRWKRAFFRYIFLPFLDMSFRLGIPAIKEVIIEADEKGRVRRTFRWFEDQGIFESEDQAINGCLGQRWGYARLPFGRLMPPESAQYGGMIFPHKKDPKKWAKPTLSLIIKDRKEDECKDKALAECLNQINQVLTPR